MKLIKPSYKILTEIDWYSVLKELEYIGRVSFQSHDRATETSHHKFVENLVKLHHDSILEFFDITVEFTIDRGISDELRTHRLASHMVESTRHVSYKDEITFIIPDWIEEIKEGTYSQEKINTIKSNILHCPTLLWLLNIEGANTYYKELIKQGLKPEDARDILPYGSLKCTHAVKANLREWIYIFKLRCTNQTHHKLRKIMLSLLDDFNNKLPEVFSNVYERINNEIKRECL
jgi:flavin-dependent thymidylate synthase